jgi:hypothetical protein
MNSTKGVADLEPQPVGQRAGDGDGVGFGDKSDGVGGIFEGIFEAVRDKVTVGERIHADKMEEFARMSGERGDHLHNGSGFTDGGIGSDDGEERFGKTEALALDGEVGAAGHEVERSAKGAEGGFVDRLDGDDGPDADGEGRDVQEGESFVGEEVAAAVGKEDAKGGGPVQGDQERMRPSTR